MEKERKRKEKREKTKENEGRKKKEEEIGKIIMEKVHTHKHKNYKLYKFLLIIFSTYSK